MAAAVQIRNNYSGDDLRRLARASEDADQACRLLALALILDGGSRGDAARTGGVGLQVIRDSLPGNACLHARVRGAALQRWWARCTEDT